MGSFLIGVDLGQRQDHSAIAVVERSAPLALRYLERVPLRTPYPDVVERIVRVTRTRPLRGRCGLVVDATGAGAPIIDLLRRAVKVSLLPVTVTCGTRQSYSHGWYSIPKRDLILGLQLILRDGGLAIAGGLPFLKELREELRSIEVRMTKSGHEQFGAWRKGAHDDLVFAIAIACWAAARQAR